MSDPVIHASDCAIHNGPAFMPAPCDCGALLAPTVHGIRTPENLTHIELRHGVIPTIPKDTDMSDEQFAKLMEVLAPVNELAVLQLTLFRNDKHLADLEDQIAAKQAHLDELEEARRYAAEANKPSLGMPAPTPDEVLADPPTIAEPFPPTVAEVEAEKPPLFPETPYVPPVDPQA